VNKKQYNFQVQELVHLWLTSQIEVANDSRPSTFDVWPLSSDTAGLHPSTIGHMTQSFYVQA